MWPAIRSFFCILSIVLGSGTVANAQGPTVGHIPRGSRVVIAPMGGFETYFAAAVREKKVPITLTLDKDSAQFFVVSTDTEWQGFIYGSAASANWSRSGGSAASGSAGSSTRGLEASIMLIDAKTKDVVWAYEVHKSSHGALLLGTLAARGKQSVAEACAKHLKEFIEKIKDSGTGAPEGLQVPGGHAEIARSTSNSSTPSSEGPNSQSSQSQQPTSPSSVTIGSTPTGAEIYLDQDFVGNTPSTINVQIGNHSITVKKTGFQDWLRDIRFSGGTITLNAELIPGTASPVTAPSKKQFSVSGGSPVAPSQGEPRPAEKSSGWLGISTKKDSAGDALVTSVTADGPAARGGLKVGDVITGVNGIRLTDESFEAQIANHKPGSTIRIGYTRSAWGFETSVVVGTNPH